MTATDENPAVVSDECAVCRRPLTTRDTINVNLVTGVIRCMDCEGIPVPGNSGERRAGLAALRDAMTAAGITAESPASLDPEGERLARQEREN